MTLVSSHLEMESTLACTTVRSRCDRNVSQKIYLTFWFHIDFSSSIVPAGLGDVLAISYVIGSRDGSISVLVRTDRGGLIVRSETVANPQWKVTFQGSTDLGYGYFARIPSSDSIYVSIPRGEVMGWQYLLSRDNGQTWTSYSDYHIGFGPITSAGENLIMFGKAGKLSVSVDGRFWIPHDQGITEPIQNLWYSPNLMSLVLSTNDAIYSAPDGNFTGASAVARPNVKLFGLLEFGSGSNAFFAGCDKFGNISYIPVTGGSWSSRTGPAVIGRYAATAMAYAEDQDVWVVGIQTFQSFSQKAMFYYSYGSGSGAGWNIDGFNFPTVDSTILSIVYANKRFVALSYTQFGENHLLSSTNGSAWSVNFKVSVPINAYACKLSVGGPTPAQKFFLFCSTPDTSNFVSEDGVDWKPLNLPSSTLRVNYLEGSNVWLATGYDWFSTSPDLTNWKEPIKNPFSSAVFDLAAQSPVTGSAVAVSTGDNTIIVNKSF
jgi:hypothetical protein